MHNIFTTFVFSHPDLMPDMDFHEDQQAEDVILMQETFKPSKIRHLMRTIQFQTSRWTGLKVASNAG